MLSKIRAQHGAKCKALSCTAGRIELEIVAKSAAVVDIVPFSRILLQDIDTGTGTSTATRRPGCNSHACRISASRDTAEVITRYLHRINGTFACCGTSCRVGLLAHCHSYTRSNRAANYLMLHGSWSWSSLLVLALEETHVSGHGSATSTAVTADWIF